MFSIEDLIDLECRPQAREVHSDIVEIKYALRPHLDALSPRYRRSLVFQALVHLAIDYAMDTMTSHKNPLAWAWFEVKEVFRQRPHARDAGLGDLL